ncbi:LOW QUALITY PROTEIN: E3 ubiquitin-protein ligase E3D [Alosa alosa]|uniref:LOW QUALITY PROTEIN: E3 ubiquitin-protein ligase E3D n=1 Tax=Alosa alosa TaxID=278164 RepID=UPI00201554A4|nr:LOW QUALITY PROTEIN: E3 ubiquitin-protein ligase E3D [Alosa alosa]
MEESGKQHEIFVELRQRLESGLLILRKDIAQCPTEVKVDSSNSSLLIQTPRGLRCAELPPGVRVVQGSCQPTPTGDGGEGLHFRLRLSVDQPAEAQGSVIERLQVQQPYGFYCQACRSRILEQRVFRRVLPLPSGNWNALVGEWCCHPDPFANRKLHPRAEDCLTGDTHFLLVRDSSCNQTLIVESKQDPASDHQLPITDKTLKSPGQPNVPPPRVSCKNCSATLGEALTRDVLKFYITEVVETESEDCETDRTGRRLEFVEKTVSARLVELSSAQSTFRFSIQGPSGTAAILLWVLNTDTLVASFPEIPVSGDDTLIFPGDSCHPSEDRSRCAVGAIKVLYLPCGPSMHQDTVSAWEKDISVHTLTLPQTTCQEVLQLLRASTSSLPPSLRCMNSYQVAFMRR